MANNIDLTNNEYNDQYNFNNHYSMLLFRPDQIVSQRDLNEEQSEWQNEFRLMGDYVFNNGTILSGMRFTTIKKYSNSINSRSNVLYKNLVSASELSAVNSVISGSASGNNSWYMNGSVDVSAEPEESNDYPGLKMDLQNIPSTSGNNITISFQVKKLDGDLDNIGFSWTNSAQLTSYSIDSVPMQNGSHKTSNLKQTAPNLDDGATHTVQGTFHVNNLSTCPIFIVANNGHDVTQSQYSVHYLISNLMVNSGTVAHDWKLAADNNQTPDEVNRNTVINISGGTIYLDGMIRQFNPQNILISGHGKETIGVSLNEDVVTAPEDTNLYDTTKGAPTEGERLADRLHYSVNLTYNDPNSVPIYRLDNGKIVNGNSSSGNKNLDALLAARTYDQSGSFRVSGFDFATKPDKTNSQFMTDIVIDSGIAYVKGYGVYKLSSTTLPIHVPHDEGQIDYEPLQFRSQNIGTSMVSEELGTQPVDADSIKVFGPVVVMGSNDADNESDDLGRKIISNGMDHSAYYTDTTMGMDLLPPVFQSQNGASGGILGTFYIHFKSPNKNQGECIYKYDARKGNTYIYHNVNQPPNTTDWDNWQITNIDYDYQNHTTSHSPKDPDVLKGSDGILPVDVDGQWYINWGQSANDSLEKDGGIGGRSIYVDGIANYAYDGPNDVTGANYPDYKIISSTNPTLTKSAKAQGVPFETSGNAVKGARIQFGGDGTTQLTPPNPFRIDIDQSTYVSYKYYKAQVATITLDDKGDFKLVKGTPAPLGEARPPEQINPNVLQLGYVTLIPDNEDKNNCEFSSVTRIPFSGLQDLVTRVSNLESTVQNNMLNIQAKENIDPTGVQNILNDDFTTFNTADLTFEAPIVNLSSDKSLVPNKFNNTYYGFSVAYDLTHGIISTEDKPNSIQALRPKLDHKDTIDYNYTHHIVTAPINKQIPEVEQKHAFNSYPIPGNIPITSNNGLLEITPNGDDFVNSNDYEFQRGHMINNIQLHNWFGYNDNLYQNENPSTHVDNNYSQGKNYNLRGLNQWAAKKSTGLETASNGVEYSSKRLIHFYTQWLAPNTKNYYILLNDKTPVNIIPDDDSQASKEGRNITINGSSYQTVDATSSGEAEGYFYLPKSVNTGTIRVTLSNSSNIGEPGNSEVSNVYYANGIRNDDTATVLHNYNASNQFNQVSPAPMAQTVLINKSSIITRLKLYFASIPTKVTDNPENNILVQLRKVTPQGYPSDIVLAQSTLRLSDISAGSKATVVQFNDPVYVAGGDSIAICLETTSSDYSMQIAHYVPNVVSYSQGTLFISNGTTYTPLPNGSVLKFELDRGSFNKNATISFSPITVNMPISKVALLVDYLTPDNTSLKWSLSGEVSSEDKSIPNKPFNLQIGRRRSIKEITDTLTDSGDITSDKNGNPLYNQVSSLQLICNLNDSPNSDTNDEKNKGYSRVSPLINADTVALAVSESINNSSYNKINMQNIQTDYAASDSNGKSIPVTPIWQVMQSADGIYLTKDIYLYGDGYNTITTTFDAHTDAHTRVIPIYSFTQGRTWGYAHSDYPGWCYYSSWNIDPASGGKSVSPLFSSHPDILPVDSEFNRYTYKVQVPGTNLDAGDSKSNFPHHFQMGLLLFSDSPYHQPMVRRLSNIMTIEDASTSGETNRPYIQSNQKENYIDFKNDANNPSASYDWRTSNNFNNDNNATF